jgi:hypothetical protein
LTLVCPDQFQLRGWSYSLDSGRTFTDGGRLPGAEVLGGDPWLAAGPNDTFITPA